MRSFILVLALLLVFAESILAQQEQINNKPVIETSPLLIHQSQGSHGIPYLPTNTKTGDSTRLTVSDALMKTMVPFLEYSGLTDPVNTVITSHNEQYFQELYATVSVTDSDGLIINGLTSSNFTVKEDNVNINQFSVEQVNTQSPISVVLTIDKSGSMGDHNKLDNAKEAATTFVNAMSSEDRAAVLSFNDSTHLDQQMTSNKSLLNSKINLIEAGGGTAFYDAIISSVQEIQCETGTRAIIALTDGEDYDSDSSVYAAINIANQNSIPVYTIGFGEMKQKTKDTLSMIADLTNGRFFDVEDPGILNEVYMLIKQSIEGQYVVGFSTLQPDLNGTSRNIDITVTYNGNSDSEDYDYTAPLAGSTEPLQIQIPDATVTIMENCQDENEAVTIWAEVKPSSGNSLQKVSLFYRTITTPELPYTEVSMSYSSSSNGFQKYYGIVPAASVLEPGVQFYISICDDLPSSITSPSFPFIQPHVFAVCPNQPPMIIHTPVETAQANTSVLINAEVTDVTDNVAGVILYYRVHNAGNYLSVGMNYVGNNHYENTIPASYVTTDDVDYYIYAVDNYGVHATHGNMDNPHVIEVSELELTITTQYINRCHNDVTTFNATIEGLPPGTTASYQWDFGDGSPLLIASPPVEHQYTNTSVQIVQYTVTCTASLSTGEEVTGTLMINVYPEPQLKVNPGCIREGQIVSFTSHSEVPVESWNLYYDSGNSSVEFASGTGNDIDVNFVFPGDVVGEVEIILIYEYIPNQVYCYDYVTVGVKSDNCIYPFAPLPGEKYVISAWVSEDMFSPPQTTFTTPVIILGFLLENELTVEMEPIRASGPIIDGWQKIEKVFTIPEDAVDITINLINSNWEIDAYFDDIRIFPVNSNMKSYVYDPVNLRFVAELDENNYATYYEYDQEGKLTRVKKETERGIVTLQESRSHTSKLSSEN